MKRTVLIATVLLGLGLGAQSVVAGPLPGAIFTTLADGSRVNANIYPDKESVYLDGGPGLNAPSGAAGLPEGDYVFQVTDPSGKVLLSTDPAGCRMFHVSADGVIVYIIPHWIAKKIRGEWVMVLCQHATGIDQDHWELGAITVQLNPYNNTPNNGGVYKVWTTPVEQFTGDLAQVDSGYSPGNYHGFSPSWSKTDCFKVRGRIIPPLVRVKKFDDSNANGIWDIGEQEIAGWQVDATDPLGVTNNYFTPAEIFALPAGLWIVTEATSVDWQQTALYIDSIAQPVSPTARVQVAGASGEVHEVIFGNIQLGDITALKFYDRDGDGIRDPGEPEIPGWKFVITGTIVNGQPYGPILKLTGPDGSVVFDELLPGDYTVSEIIPATGGWEPTTSTSQTIALTEGGTAQVAFGNVCTGMANFDTKGYWHNVNGLAEITQADIDYANSLDPYDSDTEYWESEPFDGNWTPLNPGNYFGVGAWAEISDYLASPVSAAPDRFQLAQQLLAFVFNCRHRLDNPGATIQLPDGSWVSASDLIAQAIQVWASRSSAERIVIARLLDQLNNSDAVKYIHYNPCPIVY